MTEKVLLASPSTLNFAPHHLSSFLLLIASSFSLPPLWFFFSLLKNHDYRWWGSTLFSLENCAFEPSVVPHNFFQSVSHADAHHVYGRWWLARMRRIRNGINHWFSSAPHHFSLFSFASWTTGLMFDWLKGGPDVPTERDERKKMRAKESFGSSWCYFHFTRFQSSGRLEILRIKNLWKNRRGERQR